MPLIKTQVDTTVDVELEVEVFCATCGAGLCKNSTAVKIRNRQADAIDVEACEKCLIKAKEEGFDEGFEQARNEFEVK